MIQMSASSKEIKKKERIKTVVPPFNVLATIDISYVLHFVMKLSCTVTCCLNHRAFFWYAAKPEFLVASCNFLTHPVRPIGLNILDQGKENDPPNCELAACDGGLIAIQSNEMVMETSPDQTYTIVGVLPLLPMGPFANGYK
jgi:hypothetical protein